MDYDEHFRLIDEKLDKILVQTTKTNGSVTRLQCDVLENKEDINKLKEDGNKIKGRDRAVLYVFGGVMVVTWFVIQHYILK